MKRIIIILILLITSCDVVFAQFFNKVPQSVLSTSYTSKLFNVNQSTTDSLLLTIESGTRDIFIDTASASGVTLQSNIEQLSSANRWTSDLGSWTTSGDMTATRESDASVTLSNIPTELNLSPNMLGSWTTLYQSDFSSSENLSETALISSYNYDGISDGTLSYDNTYKGFADGATSNHLAQFTGGQVSGDLCRFTGSVYLPSANTNANGVLFGNSFNSTTIISGSSTITKGAWTNFDLLIAFDNNYGTRFYETKDGTTSFTGANSSTNDIMYLYNIKMQKQVLPTGWTYSSTTQTKTNYCLVQDNGLRFISDGSFIGIVSNIGTVVGDSINYKITISENTGSGLYLLNTSGVVVATLNSVGTFTGSFINTGNTVFIKRNGNTNTVVSYVSFSKKHSIDEFKLSQSTDVSKKYKLELKHKSPTNTTTEFNPNVNFANWNYVDLLSGWNFTSGWVTYQGATGITANSWTSDADGTAGVYKTGLFASGNTYLFKLNGSLTAGYPSLRTTVNGMTIINSFGEIVKYVTQNGLIVMCLSNPSGNTTITQLQAFGLIPPTGWTSSVMNENNYVIQNTHGIKFVEGTGTTYIELSGLTANRYYRFIGDIYSRTSGELNLFVDLTEHPFNTTTGFDTIDVFIKDTKIRLQVDNNSNLVLSSLSIKEYVPNDSKLYLNYGAINDSLSLTNTAQNFTKEFWGQGSNNIKFSNSANTISNIKDISLEEITTKKVIKKGSTTKVYFTPNTTSVGQKTASITLNENKTVVFNYDVVYSPQLIANNDSLIFNNYEPINSYATAKLTFHNPSEEDLYVIPDYGYGPTAPFTEVESNYFAAAHDSAYLTFAIDPTKDSTYAVTVRFSVIDINYVHIDTVDIVFYADVNVLGTDYYVSVSGLYTNDGLTPATAINIAKLSELTLSGGDSVKFDANSYFDFPNLVLNSNGSVGNEIVLTSYNGTTVMNGGSNLEHYEYVEDLTGTSIDTIQSSLANTTMGNIGGEYYIGWRLSLTPGLLTKYFLRSTEKIPANTQVKLYEKSGTSFLPLSNTESNVNANLSTGINTFTLKTPYTISATKNYYVVLVGKEGLSGIPVPVGSVSGSDTTYFIKTNSQAWNSAASEATFSTITTPTINYRINYAVGVEIQTNSGSGNGTIFKTIMNDVADVRLNGTEGVLGESVVYDSLVNANRFNIDGSDLFVLNDTLSNIAIKKGFAIKVNGDNYKIQNLYLVRLDTALVLNGRNITVEDVYFQNCKTGFVTNDFNKIQRNTFVANKTNIVNDTTDIIANVFVNSGLHNNSAIKVNSGNADLFHNSFNQTLTSGKAQIEGNIDSLVNNAIYSNSDYYVYSTSITKALNNAYAGTSIWRYNSTNYLSGYSFASASGSVGSVIGSSFDFTSLYNLYPLETSSLIDAGISSYITKDFDNKNIPYLIDGTGQSDIGAYEYQGSVQPPTEEILGDYLTESQFDYFVSPNGVASFSNATSSTNPMSIETLINNKSNIPAGSVIGVKNGVYQYNWNTAANPDVSAFTFDNFPSNVVFKRFGNGQSKFTNLESLPGNISANWSKSASESITYDVWKINPAELYTYGNNIGLGRVWFVISGDTLEYPRFLSWNTSTVANKTVSSIVPSIVDNGGAKDSLFSPTQTGSTARSMYRWTTWQPNTMTSNSGGFYVWTGTADKPSTFYTDILITGTAKTVVTFSNTSGLKLDGLTFEGGDFETLKLQDCDNVELYNVQTKKNGYTAVTIQSCDGVEISYSNFNSGLDQIAGGGRIYYEYYSAMNGLNFTNGSSNVNVHRNNILDQTSMPLEIHAYSNPPENYEFHNNLAGATRKGHINYMRGFHISQSFSGDPNSSVDENEYRPRNIKIYNNIFRYVTREEKAGAIGMYVYFNIFEDGYQTVDSLFHHMAWRPNDVTADVMSNLDGAIYDADAEFAYFNNTFINWGSTIVSEYVGWRRNNPEYWYNNAFINVGYQNPNYSQWYKQHSFFLARKGDLPLYFRNNFIWSQYVTNASTTDWFYYGDPGNMANYKTLTEIQAEASSSDVITGNIEMNKSTYVINTFANRLNHYNAGASLQNKGYSDSKILSILGNNYYDMNGNQITNNTGALIKTLNIGAVNN